jgi:bilirubin oxidase
MFHCHNLIHEDQDMMAAFNVSMLDNFGYTETTDFFDPMDARWRAVAFDAAEFSARSGAFDESTIISHIQDLANQQPYSELEEVEEALDEYWAENGDGNPNAPGSSTSARRFRRFTA